MSNPSTGLTLAPLCRCGCGLPCPKNALGYYRVYFNDQHCNGRGKAAIMKDIRRTSRELEAQGAPHGR